jgi:hypothetical protein
MYAQLAIHNANINLKPGSLPIVGIEGLLRLVALVSQYRATLHSGDHEGVACQIEKFPPAQPNSDSRLVAATTSHEPSTADMAAYANGSWSDGIDRAEGGKP